MATIRNSDIVSKVANEDLTGAQYHCVTLMSTGLAVELTDAITEKVYGILQNAPDVGEEALVKVAGESKIVASAALATEVVVGPSTDGEAQVAVATQFPCGIVVFPVGTDQDLAVIEIIHGGIVFPSAG